MGRSGEKEQVKGGEASARSRKEGEEPFEALETLEAIRIGLAYTKIFLHLAVS